MNNTLIVVLIAETDLEYVRNTSRVIANQFRQYIEYGLMEIISPSLSYYPDFKTIYKKQTLGDPLKRVHWRTKQNLDFAYLMMYSHQKGKYYVQLEDDVVSKPNYIGEMMKYIRDLEQKAIEWFALKFCRLGFIGQMFKTKDLPHLISFLLIFHQDKPSDWLLEDLIEVRVCRKDKDAKYCKKQKDALWRTYPHSLFQHIGYHSSLEGKVQKLKDKTFNVKNFAYFAHNDNPPAKASTTLKVYQDNTIQKAYEGKTLFWSFEAKVNDTVTFDFTPPVRLKSFTFQSGNLLHPRLVLFV